MNAQSTVTVMPGQNTGHQTVDESLTGKLQRVQNCATCLVVRAPPHVHITPILRHLHWLPVRARISFKTACLCFNAIRSSIPVHLFDLLHLYSPSRSLRCCSTPASSKFHSINVRQKMTMLSLTSVLLSGTYCHCTLEISLKPPRIWLAYICLICSV